MADDNEPVFTKPASQVDLEERLANDNRSGQVLVDSDEYNRRRAAGELPDVPGRDFRVEGNDVSGYVAVDPIYQTHANDTEKPLVAEEGSEAEVFEAVANDGETVAAVADELVKDEKPSRATDETSSARPANVTTLMTPGSPATPGDVEPKEAADSSDNEGSGDDGSQAPNDPAQQPQQPPAPQVP